MKHTDRQSLISRAILLTTVAAAVTALLSCGDDDDERSEQPTHFTLIEKNHWGLIEDDCSEETAKANSDALQHAIDSLAGIDEYRIKLERGDYCVWGVDDGAKHKMIKIPSNVALDLDGSTIRLSPNDEPWTAIFEIRNAENVKLFNGTLIGDRETHTYGRLTGVRSEFGRSKDWGSHEWGWGIRVYSSHNIELYDLTLREFTGDCIIVGEVSPKCSRVTIRNNKLSRARRDGIVATNVDGLIIRDNHIFDIYNDVVHRDENDRIISIGAEAGIAFESVKIDGSETITNVQIYNNIIDGRSSENTKYCLNIHQGSEKVVIRDNVLSGDIELRYGKNILFKNNKISSGQLEPGGAVNNSSPARYGMNIIIENNEFYDYQIRSAGGSLYDGHPDHKQNLAIVGNKFYDSNMLVVSPSNMAIIDNLFVKENSTHDICIYLQLERLPKDGERYTLYLAGNTSQGDFTGPMTYFIPIIARPNTIMLPLDEAPDRTSPIPSQLPGWYYESRSRAEAVAWINSWKWY